MFPPVDRPVDDGWARELVDDAASSICVDAQDYVELDTAIRAFDGPSDRPLTDFEKYNRVVAKRMILDGELGLDAADTIDLESARIPLENVPFIRYDLFKFLVLGAGVSLPSLVETQGLTSRCGPLGSVLGVVAGVLLYEIAANPLTELMSFHPLAGGMGSYIGVYVHPSLGYGASWGYWAVCCLSVPTQLAVTLPIISQIPALNTADNSYVVWMLYFLACMLVFQIFNKRHQIGLSVFFALCTVLTMSFLLCCSWALLDGKLGPLYVAVGANSWRHGLFQDTYGSASGAGARLLQLIDATMLAYRSCSTVDKVYTLIPHVRNPRKSMKLSRWYRRARLLLFVVLPTVGYSFMLPKNDAIFSYGVTFPTLEGTFWEKLTNESDLTSADDMLCTLDLTKWPPYAGHSTYLPVLIAFARHGVCWIKPVLAGFSILSGLTASMAYLLAADHVLAQLLQDAPLSGLIKRLRPRLVRKLPAIVSVVVCIVFFTLAFVKSGALLKFLVLFQTTYSYLLMPLLCVAYLRFCKAVDLYSGPMIDRSDPDWPYRARAGTACSWITIVLIGLFCALQYFFYAVPLRIWGPLYFFAHYFFEIVLCVTAAAHWLVLRPRTVALGDINVIAAKQQLDDQEWVEDRVFHRGWGGKLVHKWDRMVRRARGLAKVKRG